MTQKIVCQADIQKIDRELQSKNTYGAEDADVARVCLALLSIGPKRESVKMLAAPIEPAKFRKYWNNLRKNGYIEGKKLSLDKDFFENDIGFLLMVNAAQGFLERTLSVDSTQTNSKEEKQDV